MLYLNPPYYIINGISLLPDHENPLQYYYLPLVPKISMFKDDATGQLVPQLQIIKFRGDAGNGGFLNFDVNLGVDQKTLDDIRSQLQEMAKLRGTPILSPVPLVDGSVKMMLFGVQSGDPGVTPGGTSTTGTTKTGGTGIVGTAGGSSSGTGGAGGTATGTALPAFVLKINQGAKPSLTQPIQAAFSVELDQYGVTILDQAIQGAIAPIGIVYSLDYLALRNAYAVKLNIDWNRVQKHLDENYGVGGIFTSIDIDKTVDQLIDQRVIDLQADTFVPEGEDDSTILSRRDRAVNEVRDMITNAFFEPSLNPVKEEKDGWDKAADFAERTSAIAATGGFGGIMTFSYKKIDYTRIDQKRLNVNISERTTVKCSIYPQGHLRGILSTITQAGLDLNQFIIPVNLGDPWFAHRAVKVYSRTDFESDSVASVDVSLLYGSEPQDVLLDSSTATGDVKWNSILTDSGTMKREVTTSYKVTFKNADNTQRPPQLTSKEQVLTGDKLEINARGSDTGENFLYAIVDVPITPLSFPWDLYPQVEVHVQYADDANGVKLNNAFLLDSTHTEQTWKMFVRDPQKTQFQYKLIYYGADNKTIEQPWVTTADQWVRVRDPYPRKRTLAISPDLDWTIVKRAFVDVTYEDKDNNVLEQQSYSFSQTNDADQTFSVSLVNPNRRIVSYEVTLVFNDNHVVKVPRSLTLSTRIIITSDMRGHKIITIHPQAIDFATVNLQQISMDIHYQDQDAGLSYADTFTFKSMGDVAHFEFDYANEAKIAYQYQLAYLYTNNLTRTVDWTQVEDEELILPVS